MVGQCIKGTCSPWIPLSGYKGPAFSHTSSRFPSYSSRFPFNNSSLSLCLSLWVICCKSALLYKQYFQGPLINGTNIGYLSGVDKCDSLDANWVKPGGNIPHITWKDFPEVIFCRSLDVTISVPLNTIILIVAEASSCVDAVPQLRT